jgi:hypothetical protein
VIAAWTAFDARAQAPSAGGAPSAADIAAARGLAREGLQLAEEGKCEAAVDKLGRAEALFHAPTTLGRLGECQVALGKLVAGTEALQRVVREELPPRASRAFRAAQERARKVLAQALARVPALVIEVRAPQGVTPEVRIDGELVAPALFGVARPTDPGAHVIEASDACCRRASARVVLAEGVRETVRLELEALPPPQVPPSPPIPIPSAAVPPRHAARFSNPYVEPLVAIPSARAPTSLITRCFPFKRRA